MQPGFKLQTIFFKKIKFLCSLFAHNGKLFNFLPMRSE